jgi:hypothetical protein
MVALMVKLPAKGSRSTTEKLRTTTTMTMDKRPIPHLQSRKVAAVDV